MSENGRELAEKWVFLKYFFPVFFFFFFFLLMRAKKWFLLGMGLKKADLGDF
jgi:hypothetical protein